MLAVVYKHKTKPGVITKPFKDITAAVKQADLLYKKGYLGVKVIEYFEETLYYPTINR